MRTWLASYLPGLSSSDCISGSQSLVGRGITQDIIRIKVTGLTAGPLGEFALLTTSQVTFLLLCSINEDDI